MSAPTVDLAQQCEELRQILGVEEPISEEVMKAALENETYARNLLICRRDPKLLAHLLKNPPRPKRTPSSMELVARGASALVRWARTGFSTVDEQVYQHRLAACQLCPHLDTPPENAQALYGLVGVRVSDRAVCTQCGCAVARKARMTSENCPVPHPARPELSRWEEPLAEEG